MPDEFVWEGVLSDGTPDLLDAWKLLRILREALEDEAKPWTWDTLEQLLVDACRAKARARPRTEFAKACRDADREAFEREGIPI